MKKVVLLGLKGGWQYREFLLTRMFAWSNALLLQVRTRAPGALLQAYLYC
jgi:hypothetical protein